MKSRPKVVRVDKKIDRGYIKEEYEGLAKVNAELVLAECANEDEIIEATKDADAVLTLWAPLTRRVMESSPKLKVIVRYGIGYDSVDVNAATDNGILVVNFPDFCLQEVADHTFALLLACARRVVYYNNLTKQGSWPQPSEMSSLLRPIYGQTLGLIGCGSIGRTVARKAKCFDLRVLGYDPYVDKSLAEEAGITLVSTMSELLKESDYVSVHTFLSKETRHLIGEKEFRQMKPTAYFFNTSRGPVVDEAALIKALQQKWIAGAGIDVFEQEPITADNPLMKMDNVVISPHTAGVSEASVKRLKLGVGEEAARVLSGKWPKNWVNKNVKPKVKLVKGD
jgi:D-3-phosphoglycerate dehydrogenase